MSTLAFNTWTNLDNSENYKCRAWVNFNGTGTVAIRAAGNVSSITDNGVGDYTINYTIPMIDVNYAPVGCVGVGANTFQITTLTTTSARIATVTPGGGLTDATFVESATFR